MVCKDILSTVRYCIKLYCWRQNNILYLILNNFQSAVMHSFGIKYVKKIVVFFNVFVIIWLLVTYVALFGLSSVEKYIEKDVNIINQEENPTTIVPPGEIISFVIDKSILFYFPKNWKIQSQCSFFIICSRNRDSTFKWPCGRLWMEVLFIP